MLWKGHSGAAGKVECAGQMQTWREGGSVLSHRQRRSDGGLGRILGLGLRPALASPESSSDAHGALLPLHGTPPYLPP